ncbi:MAG: carboxymuconolactone decarboxylase family protein [Mesosutterella sp.]|nr:carboxymuconolactone decarboxylase family protein [Mesosutterella sp.]
MKKCIAGLAAAIVLALHPAAGLEKQTAGHDRPGDLAPQFAHLNDDVLFGQVWARERELSLRDRSLITIAALFSAGLYPQLRSHPILGRRYGGKREEAVALVTHLTFYCGWSKAWSAFPIIRKVYADDGKHTAAAPEGLSAFPVGQPNTANARYFTGNSFVTKLAGSPMGVYNVTFAPGVVNNWHVHEAARGGGQILIAVSGHGWFQEWGRPLHEPLPGGTVSIPAGVKYRYGAACGS